MATIAAINMTQKSTDTTNWIIKIAPARPIMNISGYLTFGLNIDLIITYHSKI
jgi:hypothetical protein